MKYFIFILLLLGTTNSTYSQTDVFEKKFIRWYYQDKEPIVYVNALSNGIISKIKEDLLKDTIRSFSTNFVDALIISRQERSEIDSQLNELEDKGWINNVLNNSKMIDRDIVNNILKDRAYGWDNFNIKYGLGFHSFSKPIFIRNNTICFFYNDFSCPNTCGSGELAVYKIENGNWKKWLILYSWIS